MKLFTKVATLMAAVMVAASSTAAAQGYLQKVDRTHPSRVARMGSQHQFFSPIQGLVKAPVKSQAPRVPLKAGEEATHLFGSLIFATDYEARPLGLYDLTLTEPIKWVLTSSEVRPSLGATLCGNIYYSAYQVYDGGFVTDYVDAFDANTWAKLATYEVPYAMLPDGDIAADPVTNTIYGCFYSENGMYHELAKVNFENNTRETICQLYAPYAGCAFDQDGVLYAINSDGFLVSVNKHTGEESSIGFTGIESGYPGSAAIDPVNHVMYCSAAPYDGRGLLYRVDLATADTELLADFEYCEELVGLFFPSAVSTDVPGAITAASAEFTDGALSGTIRFNAPSTMADGSAGHGTLRYSLSIDGVETLTGDMDWGQEVAVPVTVAAPANYTFLVRPMVGDNKGAGVEFMKYVGNDTPKAPQVNVVREGNDNVITWTLAQTGVNEGYVNPQETTYTVTRTTDWKVIAQNISETTFTDTVEATSDIANYNYMVEATFDGRTSHAGTSNPLAIGFIQPPYLETFDNEDALTGYTIINVNDDPFIWKWIDEGVVRVNYSNTHEMDDYLVTPAVVMEEGKAYRLEFDVNAHKSGTVERFEVVMGNAPEVEALTTTLVPPTEVPYTANAYQHYTVFFTAPTGQSEIYIAFHGISDPAQYYLKLDNISISEPLNSTLPDQVTDLTITPDADGALIADISFNAPTVDLAGNPMGEISYIEVLRDNAVVGAFEDPAPGELCELFDDTMESNGLYNYTVTPYNEEGAGRSVSLKVYVGINKPGVVTNLTIDEPEEGFVHIDWDAPETDVDGNPIAPEHITYAVADYSTGTAIILARDLTDTEYSLSPVSPGEQTFVSYAVFAMTEGGIGVGITTPMIAVGTPFTLPYIEGFANGSLAYPLAISYRDPSNRGNWQVCLDDADIVSADGDGGYLGMSGSAVDAEGSIWTGKISLDDYSDPVLTFSMYNIYQGEPDWNYIEIQVECDGEVHDVDLICAADLGGEVQGWYETPAIDLSAYAGKTIRLCLTSVIQVYAWSFIDNIRLTAATGVENIATDGSANDAPTEYFDLMGRRVSPENSGHGLYIMRQGDKATKIIR